MHGNNLYIADKKIFYIIIGLPDAIYNNYKSKEYTKKIIKGYFRDFCWNISIKLSKILIGPTNRCKGNIFRSPFARHLAHKESR
jgi:hypothetical protein